MTEPVKAPPAPSPLRSPSLAGMDPLSRESGPQFVAPASTRQAILIVAPKWAVTANKSKDKLLKIVNRQSVGSERPEKSLDVKKPTTALPSPPPTSKAVDIKPA